jgi:hypothetical protein
VLVAAVFFLFLFNPLNILWSNGRWWFMRVIGRTLAAPFFPVQFEDFWFADQLNSLVLVLLDFEYLVCFLGWDQVCFFFSSMVQLTM